jgi:rhamnosyltransferase
MAAISVIIPTLNARNYLPPLVDILSRQGMTDMEVVVVDSDSDDGTAGLARSLGCSVVPISRLDFDHGGARNLAVAHAKGDILVFLTQDALPDSIDFVERLIRPLEDRSVAACYARQIAAPDATPTETFTRLHNYPPVSAVRHISGVSQRRFKDFFFSNAASAIRRDCYERVGRFPAPVPTNEDMLICAKLMDAGYWIAYVADARVMHSHNFSLSALFRRYFRMGRVVREHQSTLRIERGSDEGLRFLSDEIVFLCRTARPHWVVRAVAEMSAKALGYYCGFSWAARHARPDAGSSPRRSVARN